MKTKIEAYIPFRGEDQEIDKLVKELTSEFLKLSGDISIPLDDFGIAKLEITKVSETSIEELKDKFKSVFEYDYLEVLKFTTEINVTEIYKFDLKNIPDYISNAEMNKLTLIGLYQSRFLNLLIFSQLAIPGSLYMHKGFYLIDNQIHGIHIYPFNSNLVGWPIFEVKPNWPYLKTLTIKQVWEYIVQKTELLTTSSKTNIENGLSAFTYLIDEEINYANSLFWAMSGIEALYVDGDIGIGSQIDMKSKVFLGEPTENKRVLKELYNYRSKFLHGKMSIPINHGWIDNGRDIDSHEEEFMDMAYLASKLLIATLQEIIIRDIKEFKFSFTLDK